MAITVCCIYTTMNTHDESSIHYHVTMSISFSFPTQCRSHTHAFVELEEAILHTIPEWERPVSTVLWELWSSSDHPSQRCGRLAGLFGHQQGPGPQESQAPILCATATSHLLLLCVLWVRCTFRLVMSGVGMKWAIHTKQTVQSACRRLCV